MLSDPKSRSAFEQLLITLSKRFINLPIEAIDDDIVEALSQVGDYTGVDRCFVYLLNEADGEWAHLTHEWVAEGVTPHKQGMQPLHVGPLRWLMDQLSAGLIVHVANRDKLPDEAESLRVLYEALQIRSALLLPLMTRGKFVGALGLSCTTVSKIWSEENVSLLRIVGEIVMNAIDRHRSYSKLQASREQYRSVVQDLTNYIVRWKPDGTPLFVNSALCRFWQMSEEEFLAKNIFEHFPPDEASQIRQKISILTIDNPFNTQEHHMQLSDGTVGWHEWSDRGLFDSEGNLVEIQSIGRDITQQKRAREELEYRQQLENLILMLTLRFINLPPDRLEHEITDALREVSEFVGGERTYIYVMNEETDAADLSYQWVADDAVPTPSSLLRLPLDEHLWAVESFKQGQPVVINHLDDLPKEAENLRQMLKEIRSVSLITVPVLLHSRLYATFSITGANDNNPWNKDTIYLLRLIGEVFVNAMERKAAEEALANSEERLRSTIDAVADGFYDWNITTGEVYVSDNWLENRGLLAGANIWTLEDWQAFIHPEDRLRVVELLDTHLQGRTTAFECEYRVRMPGDKFRWTLDRGRVIERDGQSKPLRMVGVDRDITDQLADRERLQQADARLAHLSRVAMMGEIVAGIAHEVNQPLHAAATFASAVNTAISNRDPDCMDRVAEMVQKISKQINRAADIIRRMREFVRPRPVRMAKFDLNELIRESAEMPGFGSHCKNIRLSFDLDESLSPVIGDRIQVQQVIVNLLRNAFDACHMAAEKCSHSPVVIVRTLPFEERILMQVVDNGCGLTTDTEIEPLFNAFQTNKEEGMGMGLALCRSIVASHHGKIWGELNSDHGMTFSVLLPSDSERERG
ncbi:Sensor protein FixL [Aeoliella mucimassa]|uniref:histidine kinase n=2 Tax=Aeoliella mucimassa TaxID=2527972 RepID=A0A518AL77_9BACT|nr:Sensor protein FixL [Aeoliella mucimassa]